MWYGIQDVPRKRKGRLQTLRYEFHNLRMNDYESAEDSYNYVIIITKKIRLNDEQLDDKRIVGNKYSQVSLDDLN